MFCKYCGKEIDDNAKFCPSCGAPIATNDNGNNKDNYFDDNQQNNHTNINQSNNYNSNKPLPVKENVFGIVGFILSLVGIFFSLYGTVLIAGIVFSAIGLANGKKNNEKTGLALAGLIISSIALLLTILLIATCFSVSCLDYIYYPYYY